MDSVFISAIMTFQTWQRFIIAECGLKGETMRMKTVCLIVALLIVGCKKQEDIASPAQSPAPQSPSAGQGTWQTVVITPDGPQSPRAGSKVIINLDTGAASYPSNIPPVENMGQESVKPTGGSVVSSGPKLGDVPIGSRVWIEPWTIWVAEVGGGQPNKCFLNGNHPYFKQQRAGAIEVMHMTDGWLVFLHGSTFQWTAQQFPGFTGGGFDSQPVTFR